jgi:hypothetical protein
MPPIFFMFLSAGLLPSVRFISFFTCPQVLSRFPFSP